MNLQLKISPLIKVCTSNYTRRAVALLLLFLICFLLSSCNGVPEGEPPQGPIVIIENSSEQIMPLKAAVNQMVTAVATSSIVMSNVPNIIPGPTNAPERYKYEFAISSINVYSELLAMELIEANPTKSANYILSSTFVKLLKGQTEVDGNPVFKWELTLTRPGASKPDWSYSVKLRISLPNNT